MYDAVALGELLIDFTPIQRVDQIESCFQKNPGGAPANVLAAMSKQGKKTAFIGKVGQDAFGAYLASVLESNGISTEGLIYSSTENTTLAFVELDQQGDRTFTFYRKPGADMMLSEKEVDYDLISRAKVFHFGSLSLTHEPSRQATLQALRYAKRKGLLISYDPNLRLPLWSSSEAAREAILSVMHEVDILKISEEEMMFLFDCMDPDEGTRQIHGQYGISLICVTMGDKGCYYRAGSIKGFVSAFPVKAIDTTGAGDAFIGGVLSRVLEEKKNIEQLGEIELRSIVAFGNAVGSLTTTKRGGIPSIPDRSEVTQLLQTSAL